MPIRIAVSGKRLLFEVFLDALSSLPRRELYKLQLVGRMLRDIVDNHLPVWPSLKPLKMGHRCQIIITTEDTRAEVLEELGGEEVIYSMTNPCLLSYRGEYQDIYWDIHRYPQLSLSDSSDQYPLVPKYLTIHDFMLVYGKLTTTEGLRRLENIVKQWRPAPLLEGILRSNLLPSEVNDLRNIFKRGDAVYADVFETALQSQTAHPQERD